jgi:hypothetical protein
MNTQHLNPTADAGALRRHPTGMLACGFRGAFDPASKPLDLV